MHVGLSALIASSAVGAAAAGTAVTAAAGRSEYRSGGGRRGHSGASADARVGLTERSVCVLGGRVVPPRGRGGSASTCPARRVSSTGRRAAGPAVAMPSVGRCP